MALWGNKDDKLSTGTIAINGTTGVVTGVNTEFLTETKPATGKGTFGYLVVTTAGVPESYLITSVASDTSCVVKAGIPGSSMSTQTAGTVYTLNEKPRFITSDGTHTGNNPNDVYGIDTTEAVTSDDNIVGLSELNLGLGYPTAEVPAVTIASSVPVVFATTAVSTVDNTITLPLADIPATGTALTYNANSGTALAGLVDGVTYFAGVQTGGLTIKLASTYSNAIAGTFLPLTGTGNNAQDFTGNVATAVGAFAAGSLTSGSLIITNRGSNYRAIPTVTIDSPRMTIATSAISTATRKITFGGTRPSTAGYALVYQNGGGTSATGLVSGTTYYIATGAGLASADFQVKLTNAITNPAGTVATGTTGGVFTMGATALYVENVVTITGTAGGTGSIVGYADAAKSYRVSAVSGGAATTRTGFTLTEMDGTAVVTTVGTLTGLTYAIEDIPAISGTGNNAQHFIVPLTSTVVQATAEAILGSGPGGSQITHAGWVRETIGTGGRAGRVNYETLVAMGTITGEATP